MHFQAPQISKILLGRWTLAYLAGHTTYNTLATLCVGSYSTLHGIYRIYGLQWPPLSSCTLEVRWLLGM